jgi:hypothetical protein
VKARVLEEKDLVFKDGTYRVKRGQDDRRTLARTHGGQTSLPSQQGPDAGPTYKSLWERRYAQHLELLKQAGEIICWTYEPVNFRLPSKRNFYKADFIVKTKHGVQVHEVKGWSKNRRDGITKFKTAAGLNPWATFKIIRYEDGQWIET